MPAEPLSWKMHCPNDMTVFQSFSKCSNSKRSNIRTRHIKTHTVVVFPACDLKLVNYTFNNLRFHIYLFHRLTDATTFHTTSLFLFRFSRITTEIRGTR
ncbi:hypothetical protein Y032_0656g1221 [Ancylostoma ceylanicum]|uniref:Uncharacterized protein n=1 Tax=Ancylostoma ceylanicum TaxID=53326 RepID=A0A016WIJ5_9BILA|nr:hypothetical protein Y032_0656g1221 [Ancylostoma ceylanicum]